jgi:hypothetical protein
MVPNDAHRLSGNLAQPREREELEDRKPVSEGAYPADYPSLRDKSRSDRLKTSRDAHCNRAVIARPLAGYLVGGSQVGSALLS